MNVAAALIDQLGLSPAEAAEYLHINRNTVSMWRDVPPQEAGRGHVTALRALLARVDGFMGLLGVRIMRLDGAPVALAGITTDAKAQALGLPYASLHRKILARLTAEFPAVVRIEYPGIPPRRPRGHYGLTMAPLVRVGPGPRDIWHPPA